MEEKECCDESVVMSPKSVVDVGDVGDVADVAEVVESVEPVQEPVESVPVVETRVSHDVTEQVTEEAIEEGIEKSISDTFEEPIQPVAVIQEEVPPSPLDMTPLPTQMFLEFDAIQSEPAVEKIFLATGGSIAAAASRAGTDFALTGSKNSSVAELSDTYASTVRIPLSPDHFKMSKDEEMTIVMSNRTKFMACTSRSGAAINGSIVTSVSGQGAAYLSKMLKNSQSVVALPLTYEAWQAHSAVITASNFKLVDENDRHYSIRFEKDEQRDAVLKSAETVLSSWAEGAWQMRQSVLQYPYSPSLTKCVARVPVGISDSGYSLVHDVAEPAISEFSYTTLNSLLEQGIKVDLGFVEEDVEAFLEDTKYPSVKAAKNGGRTVASSMSILANFLISYRADGRTSVMPTGSVAIAAESWLRQAARTPGIEANDCDGSCLQINSILSFVASAPMEIRKQFAFINAVYNVLVPHYQVGVSVLGANSAEASSGGKREKHTPENGGMKKVAGHAVALLMPTMSILLGLERGSRQTAAGNPIVDEDKQDAFATARFEAMYPKDVVDAMPEEEQQVFVNWRAAKDGLNSCALEAFAMEGTTPASPIMYAQGKAAESARATSLNDEKAFAAVGSNIGRSLKILYAGGEEGADLHHMFYSEFVEITFRRSTPLWTDPKVRELGAACTQLVFSKHDGETKSLPVQMAGSTPAEIVQYKFALVPLVVADANTASVLDFASVASDADVLPPRPQDGHKLTEFQSSQLAKSLAHLQSLNESFKEKLGSYGDESSDELIPGHPVAFILSFSTIVNNPLAVKHLADRLKKISVSGVVDAVDIEGMMSDYKGRSAGKLVMINAVVEV